jgi:dTDP-4-dehydrorhamnose reductase
MKVVVTGAAGQLGAVVVRRFAASGHDVVAVTRERLDITAHAAVMTTVRDVAPDVIVNCAAYNDVDGAEGDCAAALDVNAFAVRSLARAAGEAGAVLVHYSTDFVFAGLEPKAHTEDERPSPQSVYATSKLLGEWFAADVPRHYVLRVESLFGGPAARSSIDRIIDALHDGREARVFVDRDVSPSYVEDVAWATERLLALDAPAGLYHCVNTGHATWAEVAAEIARQAAVQEPRLVPVKVADVALRARRPQYATLSNEKLRAAGVEMPTWQDAVARHLAARRGTSRT